MAFGDVRKCPVCPAHWIEDNQMYINPDVCPQCGADAGDYMNEYARGKAGNLSRELLLNPGVEYFAGQIDDGKSNDFENWLNSYVNDPSGKKIEAVSDCVEGGAAVKLSAASGTVRFEQTITDSLSLAGGNFRYSFWAKGDDGAGYVVVRIGPYVGNSYLTIYGSTKGIYTRYSGDVNIETDNDLIRFGLAVAGNGSCWGDAMSLKKILT